MNWTPYQINIILHYHCGVGPWPLYTAPIFPETIKYLLDCGLLNPIAEPNCYETTERGKALVDMWRATPLPQKRYVDPRFEERAA